MNMKLTLAATLALLTLLPVTVGQANLGPSSATTMTKQYLDIGIGYASDPPIVGEGFLACRSVAGYGLGGACFDLPLGTAGLLLEVRDASGTPFCCEVDFIGENHGQGEDACGDGWHEVPSWATQVLIVTQVTFSHNDCCVAIAQVCAMTTGTITITLR